MFDLKNKVNTIEHKTLYTDENDIDSVANQMKDKTDG